MTETTADQVLRLLFRYRRLVTHAEPCSREPCGECFAVHRPKLDAFIASREPIQFVILAFPAKSPNRRKVLGTLPDLGERLALQFLQSICDYVSHYYEPGARIRICSDGHVFSDLVGVHDDDVTRYLDEIKDIIEESGSASLDTYALPEAFGDLSYEEMRQTLDLSYGTSVEEVRRRVNADAAWRSLFNGIHRFMFEDRGALQPDRSRSRIREESKEQAYRVIARSNAWSRVVAETFPRAVRLSIHPQACHSEKLGIHMIRTRDSWLTPWHGAVLDDGRGFRLVKRSEAEQLNASIVWRNNRPSHFVAPQLSLEEVAS